MVVTDKRKQRGVSKEGRLRMHPDSGGLDWRYWEEMTPTEQARYREKWPDFIPPNDESKPTVSPKEFNRMTAGMRAITKDEAARLIKERQMTPVYPEPEPAPRGRYDDRINWYEQRVAALESIIKDPREDRNLRGRAASDIGQYKEAIEVYREANLIPDDETAWFVSSQGEFSHLIPPVVEEERDRVRQTRLQSGDHYYHAKSPIEIAVLRRIAKRDHTLHEKPEGTFPIFDYRLGQFEGWGNWDFYVVRQKKRYVQT